MKILVFSDSHMYMDNMIRLVKQIQPDVLIHLGDYYGDAMELSGRFPELPLYAVPGNCDQYKFGGNFPAVIVRQIDGVTFYMTHGHKHGVKFDLGKLKLEAKHAGADVVLFGHTHEAIELLDDGLRIINPGSCGALRSSAALIVTENNRISHCAILSQ